MNKIAQYLNTNLIGEVITQNDIVKQYSFDQSILSNQPVCVTFPKTTDDIRKIARFSGQLAEQNKFLPIGIRGYGNDCTGSATTSGILINTAKYFSKIIDFDPDQSQVHVQSGCRPDTIDLILKEYNLTLPLFKSAACHSIGGIISNNLVFPYFSHNNIGHQMIDQLEVVLSDGNVIQTKRISKREFNKKIGQSDSEGEVYRKIDALIEKNQELINTIDVNVIDNYGYSNIARVKVGQTFDLTPLFVGAQGSLGIITEAILCLEKRSQKSFEAIFFFESLSDAIDATADLVKLKPHFLNIYDSRIINQLFAQGKKSFFNINQDSKAGYYLVIQIKSKNKLSHRSLSSKTNTIIKKLNGECLELTSQTFEMLSNLPLSLSPLDDSLATVNIAQGAYITRNRLQLFADKIKEIEPKIGLDLPLYGSVLTNIINLKTDLNLATVVDRQRSIKVLKAYLEVVREIGGASCGSGGEGILKNLFPAVDNSTELAKLYSEIKNIFDPYGILSARVKNTISLKDLAGKISNRYNNRFYAN